MTLNNTSDVSSSGAAIAPSVDDNTAPPETIDASATSQPADPAETASPEEERKKRDSATQRRISKLVSDKANERARADFAERQLAELRAQQQGAGQQRDPASEAPDPSKYDDYNAYIKAVVDHGVKNGLAESQASTRREAHSREADEAQRQQAVRFFEEADKIGRGSSLADFDESVKSLPEDPALTAALLDSDVPAAVSYYLAHQPDDLEMVLSKRTPTAMARAIGRLEEKATEFVQSRGRSKAGRQTQPLATAGSAPQSGPSPKDSTDTWIRKRLEQRAKLR